MDIFNIILNILFFPLCIFIVFTVHELGHYIVARFFNIGVDRFSLGFGRTIWEKKDRNGTCWTVKMIPLCGHTHLSADQKDAKGIVFREAPLWQRLTIILGGPVINLILAFSVLFLFFFLWGQPSQYPMVSAVELHEAAYEAGIKPGDVFLEIEGKPVNRFQQIRDITTKSAGNNLHVKIQRGDHMIETIITPRFIEYRDINGVLRKHGRIGVMMGRVFLNIEAIEAIDGYSVKDDAGWIRTSLLSKLGQEVTLSLKSVDGLAHDYRLYLDPGLNHHLDDPDHKEYEGFYSGIVKDNFYLKRSSAQSFIAAGQETTRLITNLATLPLQLLPIDKSRVQPEAAVVNEAQFIAHKCYQFVFLVALVSVFIALLNLLPIPGLDGSMILICLLEALTGSGQAASGRAYKYIVLSSLIILYSCVMIANVNDMPYYIEKKIEGFVKPKP